MRTEISFGHETTDPDSHVLFQCHMHQTPSVCDQAESENPEQL